MIYLTHHDFKECVKNLHTKELHEQIGYICNMISKGEGDKKDFELWKFNEAKLVAYWIYSIKEYLKREDVTDGEKERILEALQEFNDLEVSTTIPFFMEEMHLGSKHLLLSHRVFLLRKRPKFYKHKYPKLHKKLSKYPKELFYMYCGDDENRKKANKQWEKIIPVPTGFAAFEDGKNVTQKYLEKEDEN